jgi:hypothetical protein
LTDNAARSARGSQYVHEEEAMPGHEDGASTRRAIVSRRKSVRPGSELNSMMIDQVTTACCKRLTEG